MAALPPPDPATATPGPMPHRRAVTIVVRWAPGVRPLWTTADQLPDGVEASNLWRCPMCAAGVARPLRPGRRRVYCTNACRQKAYRWRQARRPVLTSPQPPQRAGTGPTIHALRSDADIVAELHDPDGRQVTVCGTFAAAARDRARSFRHTNFYVVDTVGRRTISTCQRCAELTGSPRRDLADVLSEIARLPCAA